MITINGKTYSGNNISINNNQVIIDGKNVTDDHKDSKAITIVVNGKLNVLDVDIAETITVNGDVGDLSTTNGDVTCGDVKTNVKSTNGDIDVKGNIGGNVSTTNGDVEANAIHGSVTTKNGNIRK